MSATSAVWVYRYTCIPCAVMWTTPVGDEVRACWSCGSDEATTRQTWNGQPVTYRRPEDTPIGAGATT